MNNNEWQPIETAPKNEEFWVYGKIDGKPKMSVGWISQENKKTIWVNDDYGVAEEITATHWMPLPKPPTN
jgi:hypothetical protein